jgi:alpha-D-ribose 1-methylphosphonate 5-triphosphate synthase subunit PhnG
MQASIGVHGATERGDWLSVLARAPGAELAARWAALGIVPDHVLLRPPETGTAMVRARTGGTGTPFNLGEVTITRCSVQLADGTVGHAYVQGRDAVKARTAALCDALLQGNLGDRVAQTVIGPLRALLEARSAERSARAAATRVEFFTVARGEDP